MLLTMYALAPRFSTVWITFSSVETERTTTFTSGLPFPDLAQARQPVGARHAQVEQNEIGIRSRDERQHLRAGRGFAHDLEVARLLERPLDAVDDQLVIVCDQDSHGRMTSSSKSCRPIVVGAADDTAGPR